MIRRRVARCIQPITLVGGVMITLLSVWLLGVLNARAISTTSTNDRIRTVLLSSPDSRVSDTAEQPDEPEPEEEVEPEIMEVNLDMPPIDPIQPEPLELDLSLPSPTILPVQVEVEAVSPEPVPQPRPQPPIKPRPKPPARPAVHSASQVDQPPREARSNPKPTYPTAMLQDGVEGLVVLRMLIDEEGKVEDVQVVSGDQAFVDAALAVVYRWRFSPAEHDGQHVKVWGLKKLRFSVRGG